MSVKWFSSTLKILGPVYILGPIFRHFRNEEPQGNEEISQFKVKSLWNPPKGHPALESFLNKRISFFETWKGRLQFYNLTEDEYLAMRSLENKRNVIINPAGKGSSIAVWVRSDNLKEASDSNT